MWCPKCGHEKTRTIKTMNCGHYMVRIRFCEQCEWIFKTVEGIMIRKEQKDTAAGSWVSVAEELAGQEVDGGGRKI